MDRLRRFASALALPLAFAIALISFPVGAARAGLVATETVIEAREIDAERAKITAFFGRETVADDLRAMGVAPEEANRRVESLSDAEVLEIAGRIDALPAGQVDNATALIIILLVVVIIILLV